VVSRVSSISKRIAFGSILVRERERRLGAFPQDILGRADEITE
jgi:hypothetical protein